VAEYIRLIVESLFIPIVVALVIWAVKQRRKDQAEIKKTLADAGKSEAEGEVAHETIEAAVQLADINTLKEGITAMSAAFKEERESLVRRLDEAAKTAKIALARQNALAGEVDDLRGDIERYHREVLDMYRRDQYHARAIHLLTDWINDNLPRLLELRPDIPKPPVIDPLPPLHIHESEDVPMRRWYDAQPSLDSEDQEL
jgi:biopolymer transport protein ExbB/TolQ